MRLGNPSVQDVFAGEAPIQDVRKCLMVVHYISANNLRVNC